MVDASPGVLASNALTARWVAVAGRHRGDFVLSGAAVWPLLAALAAGAEGDARDELEHASGVPAEGRARGRRRGDRRDRPRRGCTGCNRPLGPRRRSAPGGLDVGPSGEHAGTAPRSSRTGSDRARCLGEGTNGRDSRSSPGPDRRADAAPAGGLPRDPYRLADAIHVVARPLGSAVRSLGRPPSDQALGKIL